MRGVAALRLVPCLLPALWCAEAHAGLFRAYLSINGSDSNACTFLAPCRLLPAALAAVNDGGEVWILDSGNFNTGGVLVDKSVTILSIPGVQGSFVTTGSARALDVNGSGIRVALRNLSFRDFGTAGYPAVRFASGASLLVENCRFSGIAGGGMAASAPGSRLMVRDSVFRHNGFVGIDLSGTVDATLDRVEVVQNNSTGVQAMDGVKLMISNSLISGNGQSGVLVRALVGGTTLATVERSTITGNFTPGLYTYASGAGSVAQSLVVRNVLSANGNIGVVSNASSGGVSTVVLDGNTIGQQPTGAAIFGSGTFWTRNNNVFDDNTTADVSGGSLTPLAGQ